MGRWSNAALPEEIFFESTYLNSSWARAQTDPSNHRQVVDIITLVTVLGFSRP